MSRISMPAGANSKALVRLLDVDPDLGSRLSPERLERARDRLVVRQVRTRAATFNDVSLASFQRSGFGLLVLEGILARELLLIDNVSVELLGPQDVIRALCPDNPEQLLQAQVRWTVVEPARFAVLDDRFAVELAAFPEVNLAVADRFVDRTHRLAIAQAISQLNGVPRRILALFWQLAERWGHVSADGVHVPLRLPHRLIAHLVGARRPTVSTALAALVADGQVGRRPDGAWILRGDPVGGPTHDVVRVVPLRKRRSVPHTSDYENHAAV